MEEVKKVVLVSQPNERNNRNDGRRQDKGGRR